MIFLGVLLGIVGVALVVYATGWAWALIWPKPGCDIEGCLCHRGNR